MSAHIGRAANAPKPKKVIKLEASRENFKTELQSAVMPDPEEITFALDIGTRTVVGIVGIQEGDYFKVLAAEVVEHKSRAMLDGQIHDIGRVAEVVKEVKDKLEKNLGITLTQVAIAAAGRVLKTCEVRADRVIEQGVEISKDAVSGLEMEAIQKAQFKLDEELDREETIQYYCVGYSVINYYLNDYVISSLLGHRGKKISVDILATFLPHVVVDSLYTVMSKVGLEVSGLTLEPIAAINVTIHKDLRLLNLALVDIGAGTSDIALTRDGSVVAYGMVPIAGDELTEKISHHYLVDFNTGEKIKISLSRKTEKIKFTDILGMKKTVGRDEVLMVLDQNIEHLAENISQKILEFNHKAPNAVFLIGGGSQIPGLTDKLAGQLKLPLERVVVRGRNVISNVKYSGKKLSGPEAITPFGIAVTAQMQKGQDFLSVTLNGKKIRLFNSKKLTVADALLLIGFNPGQLIGRSGKSLSFDLNGFKKVVRGEFGKAAEIFVNDLEANLETLLNIGDNIRVIPAEDGKNAHAVAANFVKNSSRSKVTVNGSILDINARILINGKIVVLDSEISDGDRVEIHEINTVKDILASCEILWEECILLANGVEIFPEYILKDQDVIECKPHTPLPVDDHISIKADISSCPVSDVAQELIFKDAAILNPGFGVVVNGETISLPSDKLQYIFVDIFNYIKFDLTRPQGNIILKLNGRQAAFTDVIRPGDIIEVYWEKSF